MKVSIELDEQALVRWPLASLRKHAALCNEVLERREASAKLAHEQREARKQRGYWHKVGKRKQFLDTGLMWAGIFLEMECKRLPVLQRDPTTERFMDFPVRYDRGSNSFCKAAEIMALRECNKMLHQFEAKHRVAVRVFSVKGNATGIYHKDRAALRVDLMPGVTPDIDAAMEAMEPVTYQSIISNYDAWLAEYCAIPRV